MRKVLLVVSIVLFNVSTPYAQGLGMPPKIMAAITGKILNYVDNFPGKTVSIIYKTGQEKTVKSLVSAFSEAGLKADGVAGTKSAQAGGDIIILLPGLSDSELNQVPVVKRMVIAADKSVTDKGMASFSIVNNQGKPQILVNMQHIGKSGLKVSGKLYRVAKKSA